MNFAKLLCSGITNNFLSNQKTTYGQTRVCLFDNYEHHCHFRANNDCKTIKDLTEYYRRNTNLFLVNRARSIRSKLWLILDEPRSSTFAKVGSTVLYFKTRLNSLLRMILLRFDAKKSIRG